MQERVDTNRTYLRAEDGSKLPSEGVVRTPSICVIAWDCTSPGFRARVQEQGCYQLDLAPDPLLRAFTPGRRLQWTLDAQPAGGETACTVIKKYRSCEGMPGRGLVHIKIRVQCIGPKISFGGLSVISPSGAGAVEEALPVITSRRAPTPMPLLGTHCAATKYLIDLQTNLGPLGSFVDND